MSTEKSDALEERRRADAISAFEESASYFKEMNGAVMDAANVAIKSLFVINGGSVVALLALIANLLGQPEVSGIGEISAAMFAFAIGVAAATATACATYLTNYSYISESTSSQRTWEHPFVVSTTSSKRWGVSGRIFHVTAISCALASFICFLYGIIKVRTALEMMF